MMFKGCPRCGGNMYLEEEGRFRDLVCLQCGHRPPNTDQLIRAATQAAGAGSSGR